MMNNQISNQWISCSKKMPEEEVPVLLTVKMHDSHRQVSIGYFGDDHRWYLSDNLFKPLEVLAWMPLVKPYGEENA